MPPSALYTPPKKNEELISQVTLTSAVATVDFTSFINDTLYDAYKIVGINIVPATDLVYFWNRISTDNGVTFLAGAGAYGHAVYDHAAAGGFYNGTTSTWLFSNNQVSNNSNYGVNFEAYYGEPSSAGKQPLVRARGGLVVATTLVLAGFHMFGNYGSVGAYNALRFMFSSGNISSGIFKLYGVRK